MKIQEIDRKVPNGWATLFTLLAVGVGFVAFVIWRAVGMAGSYATVRSVFALIAFSVPFTIVWIFLMVGFFTLQPNMAAVLILFGAYKGTVNQTGFCWSNPLYTKKKVSRRSRNLNGQPIKVNDLRGNPIEIAAVVVWRVENTAHAVFDVDDFEDYVNIQSEAAVRHLASAYPYDDFDSDERSLRGNMEEVNADLQAELLERVTKAGVVIEEARLSHLAYAPEIAGSMLQRQQAEAVVAARQRIVDGAVGMVEMALDHLDKSQSVNLDEERKAAMVSNLLVILCGDKPAQPVINTGTLYTG